MPTPAPGPGPYATRLSQAIMQEETTYGVDAINPTVTLVGVINGVNLVFDIPNSEDSNEQVVANDFVAYSDGVPDPGATFSQGTGGGGEDQIIFVVAPTVSATAAVVQGQPLNFGGLQIQVESDEVDRVANNRAFDRPEANPSQREWALSFNMPWMNGGAAGVPPPLGAVLKACGFGETITPGVKVVYQLLNENFGSASLWCYMGMHVRKAKGMRGDFTAQFTAGQVGVLAASLRSPYQIPIDRGYPTGLVDPTNPEPIVELANLSLGPHSLAPTQIDNLAGYGSGATVLTVDSTAGLAAGDLLMPAGTHEVMQVVTVDSATQITVLRGVRGTVAVALVDNQAIQKQYKPCGDEFSLALGNEVNKDLCYNAAEGLAGEAISSRLATGVVQVRAVTEADRAWWGDFTNGSYRQFGFQIGQVAGQRVALYAPKARIIRPEDVEVNEAYSLNLNLAFQPDGSQPALTLVFF